MKIHIYAIKNLTNNKMYIGSTKSIKSRKYEHFYQLKLNKHHSQHLQNSYNKYGKDNFAFYILEECSSENRKERELHYILINKSHEREFGYNIHEPNDKNFKCSIELKAKLRDSKKDKFVSVDVYNLKGDLLNSFESSMDCSKYYNLTTSTIISDVIKGKRKSYKQMVFIKKGEKFKYTPSKMQRDMCKFYK